MKKIKLTVYIVLATMAYFMPFLYFRDFLAVLWGMFGWIPVLMWYEVMTEQ